jgi:hypothetical protein
VETVEVPAVADRGADPGRVLSPEEVAREFLREGGGAAQLEQNAEEDRPRRVRTAFSRTSGAVVAENDRGAASGPVLSPEEVAREFLREGGGAAPQEDSAEDWPRRVRIPYSLVTGAAVICAVVVLALLVFLILIPDRPASSPGASKPTPHSGRTSTPATANPLPPTSSVRVDLLNAYQSGQRPTATYLSLRSDGFAVSAIGTAPSLIAAGQPSQIFYGPSGLAAAETLAYWLIGPVRDVYNANLPGNDLELWIANPLLGVIPSTTTTTASAASTPPPAP